MSRRAPAPGPRRLRGGRGRRSFPAAAPGAATPPPEGGFPGARRRGLARGSSLWMPPASSFVPPHRPGPSSWRESSRRHPLCGWGSDPGNPSGGIIHLPGRRRRRLKDNLTLSPAPAAEGKPALGRPAAAGREGVFGNPLLPQRAPALRAGVRRSAGCPKQSEPRSVLGRLWLLPL